MMGDEKREVLLRPEGVFDVDAARRFSELLSRARPDEVFIIDLGQAGDFHDYSIAVLAGVLGGSCAARIVVRGLCQHHVRLLRYFGIDLAALEAGRGDRRSPRASVPARLEA
ncbi:MAG TPA: hypothetical protein VF400_10625 [Anaeromyxobacteraceae bacterium]